MERKILFDPNVTKFNPIPETLKNAIQNITTKTKDGLNLQHYYIPSDEDKKTVIFCHGKSENATKHFNVAEFLNKNGYGVLLLEYRGFGKNPGTPSEKGLYKDLDSAVDYLQAHGVSKKQVVLWGFSLGGGVVSEAAKSNKFGGIILNSTFSDMNNAAKHFMDNGRLKLFNNKFAQKTMESLPARMIPIRNKFRNQAKMKKVHTKTLIIHAKNDPIIPYKMSTKLAQTTPNSGLYLSETGRHSTNRWTEGTILNFLESLN
jgi:alpha-beta hydrolase superfamily lysophospholipase